MTRQSSRLELHFVSISKHTQKVLKQWQCSTSTRFSAFLICPLKKLSFTVYILVNVFVRVCSSVHVHVSCIVAVFWENVTACFCYDMTYED